MAKGQSAAPDKFREWVLSIGKLNLAVKYGCHQTTIERWCARRSLPSVPNMIDLVEMSNGSVDYVDIIVPFYKRNPHLLERRPTANNH